MLVDKSVQIQHGLASTVEADEAAGGCCACARCIAYGGVVGAVQDAAVAKDVVHTELGGFGQLEFADDDLDHHLRLTGVEFVNEGEGFFFHVARADDDDRVGAFVGDDGAFADLLGDWLGIALAGGKGFAECAGFAAASSSAKAAPISVVVVQIGIRLSLLPRAKSVCGAACSAAAVFVTGVFDGGDDGIHDFLDGAEAQRAHGWLGEMRLGVVFFDERADELHVDRARDDVDAVGALVRGDLHFADDDVVLGRPEAAGAAVDFDGDVAFRIGGVGSRYVWDRRAVGVGDDTAIHTRCVRCAGLLCFFKKVGEAFHDILGLRVFERDEFADDLCRLDINRPDDAAECADDGGVFSDEQRVRLRQRHDVGEAGLIRHEDAGLDGLSEFGRVRPLEFEKIHHHLLVCGQQFLTVYERDADLLGVDAHAGDAHDFFVLCRDDVETVDREAHFHELDGLAFRHAVAGDEDGDLSDELSAVDEPLAGNALVMAEHVADVGVDVLQLFHRFHRLRDRDWRGRGDG